MSDSAEILSTVLTSDLILGIDKVGAKKADSIVAICRTLGDLLRTTPAALAGEVKGLSEHTAAQVIAWARGEYSRISAEEIASDVSDLDHVVHILDDDEEILEGEADDGSGDTVGGLLYTDFPAVHVKSFSFNTPRGDVLEIRPIHDKKIVFRKEKS